MKKTISIIAVLVGIIMALPVDVSAQPMGGRGRGIYGDWMVSQEFNGMQMDSILSISREQGGGTTGQWISMWGLDDLQNVQFQDGQLTFRQVREGFDGQSMTSTFKGTISEDRLVGTISSDRGDSRLEGRRAPRMPRGAGIWNLAMRFGEREMPITLTISADEQGEATAKWASERGEAQVSNVEFTRNELAFTVTSSIGDRQWESRFEGAIEGENLSGALRSEMGDIAVEGRRQGADLIGTWNLQVVSERGTRPQRLVVNPDLSALYGATTIDKVDFTGGQIRFKIVREFGERTMEMDFTGKIQDSKLEGELSTQMGSQRVTGTREVRRGLRPM